MATDENIPSYEDVIAVFGTIRQQSGWDYEHPLRRFVHASTWANITRECERIAAYRLKGSVPPLGYYDEILDHLHYAIDLLMKERQADHGDAPICLRDPMSVKFGGPRNGA